VQDFSLESKRSIGDLEVTGRIILKWVLGKLDARPWTGFNCHRVRYID
jgi:hypothetical protein